jgi:hypothetical protein
LVDEVDVDDDVWRVDRNRLRPRVTEASISRRIGLRIVDLSRLRVADVDVRLMMLLLIRDESIVTVFVRG